MLLIVFITQNEARPVHDRLQNFPRVLLRHWHNGRKILSAKCLMSENEELKHG